MVAARPPTPLSHYDRLRPRRPAPPRRQPRPRAPPRSDRRSWRDAAGHAPVDGTAVDVANRAEVALVEATAVEVAVNVPAALCALVALELAQVAAPGRATVVQCAPVAVERLGDDGCVVVVGVREAGEEDEEGHEKEVTRRTSGHS